MDFIGKDLRGEELYVRLDSLEDLEVLYRRSSGWLGLRVCRLSVSFQITMFKT